MNLPPELFPEAISLKQLVFLGMTIGFFVVMIPLSMKFKWMDRVSMAAMLFMATSPIDVTFFSYTNYRGDIRGIEFGMTDWFAILLAIIMTNAPHWRKHRLYFRNPNEFLMGIYLLYCFTSIFTAVVPQFAFFGFTKLLRAYLTFWVAYNYVRTEKDLRFILACVIGLTFYNFIQVLLDKYMRGLFPPRSPFLHQNTLSTFQNILNFIIFAFFLQESNKVFDKKNLLYWAALGTGSLTTVATLSRGGMATMVIGYMMIVAMSFFLKQHSSKQKKKLSALGVISLISLPILAFILPPIINRFQNAPKESAEARHVFNDLAYQLGTDYFFGIGLNNYSFAGKYMQYSQDLPSIDQGGLAHHIYWLHFGELGIIGLLSFVLMMAGFIFILFKFVLKRADSTERIFGIGLLTAFCIFALIGTLEWLFRQIQITVIYFTLAGVAMSLTRIEKNSQKERKMEKIRRHYLYRLWSMQRSKRT